MDHLNPAIVVSPLMVWLGLRLVVMAARNHTLAEAILGGGFCLGSVGMAFLSAVSTGDLSSSIGLPLAHAHVNAGLSLFVLFSYRVFRPGIAWARVLTVAGVAALAGSWCALAVVANFEPKAAWAHFLITATRLVPFAWLGVETALQHQRLRRQRSLGLGDPVVANRFLLWSVWNACLFAVPAMGLMLLSRGIVPETSELFLSLASPFGAVAGFALWLSFFPPHRYQQWLRAGARLSAAER